MIIQSYALRTAADTKADCLAVLSELAALLKASEGCRDALILQSRDDERDVGFLEFWADDAARLAAGMSIPKELMGRLMSALEGRPGIRSYEAVSG
ncbi:antibiotic biosynthesis monooxygenase [Sphingobium sp. WCS2017Hpa-17]|uniref:putative quinol monooxygenase n=1 Tax=Sphingobium sp. WCS2017Hpa-17 TaxID=3073638 RepID=UPI002888FAE8|nr:antibiotic biosynthesis monooxygenase [Sphingobium sp. WCS2017Hpa-17]